jgi:hypothetical protein
MCPRQEAAPRHLSGAAGSDGIICHLTQIGEFVPGFFSKGERSMKRAIVLVSVLALAASAAMAGQVGFEEEFALAKDRSDVLKQLIAGTEEYYYYTCLHYQNTGQLDKVEELLTPWIKRYGNTAQVEEVRNRQALLGYPTDADKSLAFIKWRLGLTFSHQQEPLDKKSNLPTRLDATLISRDRLT